MKVLGRDRLDKFGKKHADAKTALDSWFHEVSATECQWKTSQDIKKRYASASFLADNRVIFNIKGNNYRLAVRVRYQNGLVAVEWVGTHAEYDKKTF
jgi:mRNA interferase HigB